MLVARGLTKEYQSGAHPLTVLRDVSFDIEAGAFVSIVGPSGSGKTTLLGLLAGLDTPTRGTVHLDGAELGALDEDARARLRGEKVGFVFQSFQLIPTLTAQENVQVPLELAGTASPREAAERAQGLLERVGLGDRRHHFPQQLSGGEQQRVALARAFVNAPRVLFADEPTGNLDGATGERIVELLRGLNRERGCTIVLVTHDAGLAARTQRTIRLRDGVVVADERHPAAEG
jgi:putative ABC transport system ATP-binding protein